MKKIILLCLVLLCSSTITAQQTAEAIVADAISQAKAENKNIFIKFEASWCGWCQRMTKQMESTELKEFFEKNYVIKHVTVLETKKNKKLETPGGTELLSSYNAEKAGLPFFVILDNKGTLLRDSFYDNGQNLGCPASKKEVSIFIDMLKETSSLQEKALDQIKTIFTKK